MTLPFENDTSRVVKKLAKQDIKANKRTSISIMVAILIASTFLCALFTFVQSYWNQSIQREIYQAGDWDAELLDIQAKQLAEIQKNDNVQKIMTKGNNQTAQLPDGTGLPFLLVQNCDAQYWDSMHEKNLMIQGRVPQAPDEIVVGKSFFEQNPSYQIGDTISVVLGERKVGLEPVDFLSPTQSGETFEKVEEAQYTIVGEIDMTVSSAYNGYPAYGWLDPPVLPGDTDLVAYLQVKNPSAIFDTIPQIAQTIGMKADEYGDYPYRYHTALLGLYGIYEPGHFWNSDLPKLFLAVVLVVLASMTVFSYIIRGAFSISAKRKMKELGILKSIGMTSKQVQRMVFYEARQLAFLPILLSVGLGYLFSYGVLTGYSELVGDAMEHPITVSFSPWVALGSMVLSFLTVLLAASGPAKQVGKFRPIEAVKESWNLTTLKKSKKHTLLKKWFGFIGKLSANSIAANRYDACLAKAGVEPLENGTAIVVNSVVKNPDSRGYEAKKEMTSYLNLETGQSLNITEKFLDSIQGNYTFDLNVGTTIQELPDIGLHTAFYTLPILVPMDEYYRIIGNFSEDRAVYNYRTYMNLAVEDGLDAQIQKDANQICSAYLSSDDFYTSSKTERAITRDQLTNATMLVVYSLTALFGIVGISSATSAILNSLYQRRKDFAMLRSVGLDKKGLHRLLSIEGFLLAFKPILFGLPVLFFIVGAVLWMQDVTFGEFLGVFSLWGLLAFIVLTLLLISGIYAFASRQIRKDIVVEVLKDETV